MNNFLAALISVALGAAPWSKPEPDPYEDYYWTKNDWMNIPLERRMHVPVENPDETCSRIYGPYSGGEKYAGCVAYGYDEDGLLSTVFGPKKSSRANSDVWEHEERHAAGEVHPWPGFLKQTGQGQ